jgi:uncharacterized YccA/Bax inhibitor family protein
MARGSSNPVLTRAFPERPDLAPPGWYAAERLTIDDVVVHTVGLLALLTVVAGVTWNFVSFETAGKLYLPAALVTIGLIIYANFKRQIPPAVAVTYAAVEGFLLGTISRAFETRYNGIALQALVCTISVFVTMLALYQTGTIRATPQMRKVVNTAVIGIFVTYLVSFAMSVFFDASMPLLNNSGPLGILLSLAIIGVAAFLLILDFDVIERAIANGAPRQFAWTASFGLLVTLVWLYVEFLRLLSKLRD